MPGADLFDNGLGYFAFTGCIRELQHKGRCMSHHATFVLLYTIVLFALCYGYGEKQFKMSPPYYSLLSTKCLSWLIY